MWLGLKLISGKTSIFFHNLSRVKSIKQRRAKLLLSFNMTTTTTFFFSAAIATTTTNAADTATDT